MKHRDLLPISSFAEFSRTTRDTLIHYDKIGLMHPVFRGENNYRFYSPKQLAVVNFIRTCQSLGMQLSEIKELIEHRTPQQIYELLGTQISKFDEKLSEWKRSRKLLVHFQNIICTALNAETAAITVEELPEESIELGCVNDYGNGRNDYDALLSFYRSINANHPDMDLNYPVWGWFSKESVESGKWFWPDRFYFNSPEGRDKRPAGLYAVGYGKGGYGKNEDIFKKMTAYISANRYKISGATYVEYPLNEISVPNPSDYLVRVIMSVTKLNP